MSTENDKRVYNFNLLDHLLLLLENKKRILLIVISVTLLSLVVSFIWPKSYRSSVQFMQLKDSRGGGIGGMLGDVVQLPMSMNKVGQEAGLVILRSKNMKDKIIEKFDLMDVYDAEVIESARDKVKSRTDIEEVREGGFGFNPIVSVEVSYTDRKPERAQKIASFYVNRLDSIMTRLNRQNARQSYEVFKNRYEQNLKDLHKAEDSLLAFQEKHGVLEVESQTKNLIENAAQVKAQLTSLEVRINVLKRTVKGESSKLNNLINQKEELENTYNELVRKSDQQIEKGIKKDDFMHPLMDMPQLVREYMGLYRKVKVQEKIYETIYPQFEQQKMMLEKSDSGIQIIDDADYPTYKYKPKKAYIVIAGFFFSIVLSLIIVYFDHYVQRKKEGDSETYQKLTSIKDHLMFRK